MADGLRFSLKEKRTVRRMVQSLHPGTDKSSFEALWSDVAFLVSDKVQSNFSSWLDFSLALLLVRICYICTKVPFNSSGPYLRITLVFPVSEASILVITRSATLYVVVILFKDGEMVISTVVSSHSTW